MRKSPNELTAKRRRTTQNLDGKGGTTVDGASMRK